MRSGQSYPLRREKASCRALPRLHKLASMPLSNSDNDRGACNSEVELRNAPGNRPSRDLEYAAQGVILAVISLEP